MKIANSSIIRPAGSSVAIPFTSEAIYVGSISDYAIQLKYVTTGANIKIQCSCDEGKPLGQSWIGENIINWTDITDSSTDVTEDGDILFDVAEVSYRWIRVVITGTGFVTSARFQFKAGT
jgi:hypothetical protein